MDWRFNGIWFEKIPKELFFSKDYKENRLMSENSNLSESEYAILWHLKENKLSELNDFKKLKYLELNWSNIKDFSFLENLNQINRLKLECCIKLESDKGISRIKESLQFLEIMTSKKFQFRDEFLELKKLRVLGLNSCGDIDNLDFLEHLPSLVDIRFVNTNIISGDLTPILNHKSIKNVYFLDKRHYNFKYSKLSKLLEEKEVELVKTFEYKNEFRTFRYDYL